MKDLIAQLNKATKAYDEGHPIMTDKEWDDLYFKLLEMERDTGIIYPNSPTQTISYEVVNKLPKVEHNHKMLSLDKTKSPAEVDAFLGNKESVAMAKLDGLTCSLRYMDGKLTSAETRGNGIIGEDITHNAKVIPSIPKEISYKDELIVDGEVVCMIDDFKSFEDTYKNPRNFAAGSIRLLDANECAKRNLTFIAWDVIKGFDDDNSFVSRLTHLQDLGFEIVPWIKENPTYAIGDIQDYCQDHNYPIDGVVFKFDDVAYGKSLGETAHHFKNAIAYKFYDDEYETTLLNIDWGMGRTGVLTPVAIFDPVDIDGSVVSRASLHNLNILDETLGDAPHLHQDIKVAKMNMIIPQVVWADKTIHGVLYYYDYPTFTYPEVCPICGQPTKIIVSDNGIRELYCSNPACEGKLVNKIDHFLGKKGLDIKGISTATLEKLIDWGWITKIKDIYNLSQYKNEWIRKPGFGEKSVSKILETIENSKTCELDKFICAIGIPLIGTSMSKQLAKAFHTYDGFRNAVKMHYDFTLLDDFGFVTLDAIMKFDYTEADELANELNIIYTEPEENISQNLNGKKIVITGTLSHFKNRAELQKVIENAGGKVVSSVTRSTNILINNNSSSTSAKNVAAKQLGIPILTEEEFLEQYID